MAQSRIQIETAARVAYLRLNAPPGNEMDLAFFDDLRAFCERDLAHLDVRGLIVCGRGRHFSSGANVPEMRQASHQGKGEQFRTRLEANVRSFLAIERLPYPVVAAVSGCCLGAGLELALACHFRIAADRAVFALPESTFGLLPGCGGTVRLARLVGRGKAAELILSGRTVLAEEAKELGIVDAVVSRGALLDAARRAVARRRAIA